MSKMIEHGKTEHYEREQAKRHGGEPRHFIFVHAPISFIPEPMETQPKPVDEGWICLTPCHSGLSPLVAPGIVVRLGR